MDCDVEGRLLDSDDWVETVDTVSSGALYELFKLILEKNLRIEFGRGETGEASPVDRCILEVDFLEASPRGVSETKLVDRVGALLFR